MDILLRLDEIEKAGLLAEETSEAVELMIVYASEPRNLELLARRYSTASSTAVKYALANCLAKARWKPNFESTGNLVFSVVSDYLDCARPETLVTLLDAIKFEVERLIGDAPTVVGEFVNRCIGYRGRLDALVWAAAMDVVERSIDSSTTDHLFGPDGRRRTVLELRQIAEADPAVRRLSLRLAESLDSTDVPPMQPTK